MIPVVLVVGPSGVGKTTFLEKLLPRLKERGLRAAYLKHFHGDFSLDQPGKDTWRLARAGADAVALSTPQKFALIRRLEGELSLEEIVEGLRDYDLVLAEGYKGAPYPKLQVFRRGFPAKLLAPPGYLIGAVADSPLDLDVPTFAFTDIEGVAGLLLDYCRQCRGKGAGKETV